MRCRSFSLSMAPAQKMPKDIKNKHFFLLFRTPKISALARVPHQSLSNLSLLTFRCRGPEAPAPAGLSCRGSYIWSSCVCPDAPLLYADLHVALMRHYMSKAYASHCHVQPELRHRSSAKAMLFLDKKLLHTSGFPFSRDFSS